MSSPTNHSPNHFWKQQSPINFVKDHSIHVKFPKSFLKFEYKDAPFLGRLEGADGHGNFVLDKPHSGSNLPMFTMGNVTAELIKIHLHTPSEHDIEGKDLGGEIHLIHRLASPVNGSELVVVGVFFNVDKAAEKREFFSMWAAQVDPKSKVTPDSKGVKLDPRGIVPKNPNSENWFRYEGSLTSEPYSEIVSWLVFADPIGVLPAEFKILKEHAHQPERPMQPINRRYVLRNFP
jgi:carbonic anhydrase